MPTKEITYLIPISLNYCPPVRVKILHGSVAFNLNSSYCSIKRPALIYFSYTQQDHKLRNWYNFCAS